MAASLCRNKIFNYRNNIFHSLYRTGYIVLIPESARECELLSNNPSYETIEFNPEYKTFKGDLCKQLFTKQCQDYDAQFFFVVEQAKAMAERGEKVDVIKTIFEPLEKEVAAAYSASAYAAALYAMDESQMTQKEYKDIDDRMNFSVNDRLCNQSLYDLCNRALQDEDKYNEEEKRLLKKYQHCGELSGLNLPELKKHHVKHLSYALEDKINLCRQRIEYCLANTHSIIEDGNRFKEFPDDIMRVTAPSLGEIYDGPWKITHHQFVHNRFLEFCPSREHRYSHYIDKRKMCSPFLDDIRIDNSRDLRDIRKLRTEIANELGYDNYFDFRMATKMIESSEEVENFLLLLLQKAKEVQEKEISVLEAFAYERGFEGNIELWDFDFWARKHAKSLYQFDEIAMMDYFPLNQVLLGLFSLCEQLFGIEIKQQNLNTSWHQDVRYYEIFEEKSKEKLGEFYLDPFARERKVIDENLAGELVMLKTPCKRLGTIPSALLLFHFCPPTEKKPCLLYFRDVKNLFAKFGYLLQILLIEAQHVEMGNFLNIEQDAQGTVARFLEQWVYEKGTLESISGHYKTGEPLPKEIIDNMEEVRKHMAATRLCIDIYHANLDIKLHTDKEFATMDVVRQLWPNHLLFHLDDYDLHPYTFKETIYGQLTCSYYSKIWSQIMGLDAFSAFAEAGFSNHEQIAKLGKRFRTTFLALGGTRHAGEVFKRFRGRNPSPYALLDSYNIDPNKIITSSTVNDRPTPVLTA